MHLRASKDIPLEIVSESEDLIEIAVADEINAKQSGQDRQTLPHAGLPHANRLKPDHNQRHPNMSGVHEPSCSLRAGGRWEQPPSSGATP